MPAGTLAASIGEGRNASRFQEFSLLTVSSDRHAADASNASGAVLRRTRLSSNFPSSMLNVVSRTASRHCARLRQDLA